MTTAAPAPNVFATNVYSDPVAAMRFVNVFTVVAIRSARPIARASDQTDAPPATTAMSSGIVVAAAAGATADTDWASTSAKPTLRRSRPCMGERLPSPGTGSGDAIARSSAVMRAA